MISRAHLSRALPLLAGLAALLLYWPARNYGLIWDDYLYLGVAAEFHDWNSLWPWVVRPFFGYFRPLPLLTLGAEQLAGSFPYLAHLDQLLLHALNSVLVACVARRVCRAQTARPPARWPALAAGLLYAVHPALTEAAVWLSARFDLMVTSFVLAALLMDRAVAPAGRRAAAVASVFFLALLCKEMAAGLLLVLPLWHLLFEPPERRSWPLAKRLREGGHLRTYAAMIAALAACVTLRLEFLGFLRLAPLHQAWSNAAEHFALVCKTLGGFLRMALFPFGATSPVHPLVPPARMDDPEALAGLGVLLLLPWMAHRALRGSGVALLVLCFIVSLLPVLNLVALALQDNYLHERFLVLPLAFAAVAVALALQHRHTRGYGRAAAAIAAICLIAAAAQARANLATWRDDISLWRHAYARDPGSEVGASNLLESYLRARRYAEVKALAQELMQRSGGRLAPFHRLVYAEALTELQEPAEARAQLQAALSSAPEADLSLRARGYALSGRLFLMQGDLPRAREDLERSLRYDADQDGAEFNLAAVLQVQGLREEAQKRLRRVLVRSGDGAAQGAMGATGRRAFAVLILG